MFVSYHFSLRVSKGYYSVNPRGVYLFTRDEEQQSGRVKMVLAVNPEVLKGQGSTGVSICIAQKWR